MNFLGKKCVAALTILSLLSPTSGFAFAVDIAPGTPVVEALRALGFKSNRDIMINGDIQGTVSLTMKDATLEKCLEYMSATCGFNYEICEDGAVLVGPQKTMNALETFKLHNADPEKVVKQIAPILEDDNDAVANTDNRSITVRGSANILKRVQQQLKKIDEAQQQVTIKAEVIELNRSKGRDVGISWTTDSWSHTTGTVHDGFKFAISAAHEETSGKGKVLARPSITTFDGIAANILMGDKVPVFTSTSTSNGEANATVNVEYKDVGVKLEVQPFINDLNKGIVSVKVKPSISTISNWVESGNNKAPQISERSAETTVRVKSGETILLGGLLKDEELRSMKAIPLLSKIPILGEIFKSRSLSKKTTEIVIAITPTIIYDKDGRPKVEMQRMTPNLKDEMNKLKGEDSEYNKQHKDKNLDLEENARLKREIAKLKKEKAKNSKDNKKMREELEANNAVLKRIIMERKKI